MSTRSAVPPIFKDVDYLAREIVDAIFIANGIRMTNEPGDPLLKALTAEVVRRAAAMQAGAKAPTQGEQIAAALRVRRYGCWLCPFSEDSASAAVFADSAQDWQSDLDDSYEVRRPYPGKAAAQAVARLAIQRLHPDPPIDEQPPVKSEKPRRA